MKFLVLPTTLFAFFAAGLLSGQENPASAEAEKSSAPNYVSINKSSSGENMLLVEIPLEHSCEGFDRSSAGDREKRL